MIEAGREATGREATAAEAAPAVTIRSITQAAARLGTDVHQTPLFESRTLDRRCGAARIRIKGEHLQRSGSFKLRGALNAVRRLSDEQRRTGVVAFSSGNHAQGLALAARIEGIRATIVMPADAPQAKLDATVGYGADVVLYERSTDDREQVANRVLSVRGGTLIPPFDHADVIAGQGTVATELVAEWPEFDMALVPIGGGGLAAGMAVALHAHNASIEIWGVEPEVADDARQSLAAGRIVHIPPPSTLADGVATTHLGQLTFPILQHHLRGIITVTEEEIAEGLRFVVTRMKQVVEPTGALTTAALLSGKVDVRGQKVATVFCGGNLDLDRFRAAVSS